MCGSRHSPRQHRASSEDLLALHRADPAARVGDADRDAVLDDLLAAGSEGYLRPEELDERTTRALDARTAGQLSVLLEDLPPTWRRRRTTERRAARAAAAAARAARASLRPHVTAYVLVMTLLVAVWLTVGLTTGAWYPWPLWPALFWGISVVGHVRTARAGRPGRPLAAGAPPRAPARV